MQIETSILSAIAYSRDDFYTVNSLLDVKEFSDKGQILYKAFKHFYNNDSGADKVDLHIIKAKISRKYGKKAEVLVDYLDSLKKTSSRNLLEELKEMRLHYLGSELANDLLNGTEAQVRSGIDSYLHVLNCGVQDDPEQEAQEGYGARVVTEEDAAQEEEESGYVLYPTPLAKIVGKAYPGHHIVIFAEPEAGKTLLSINMVAGFLRQGAKVMYLGTEEPRRDLLHRFLSRLSGADVNKIKNSLTVRRASELKARKRGYNNLLVRQLHSATFSDIESLIVKYSPDILFVDQIRHIHTPGIDGDSQRLTAQSNFMRTVGKKYGLIVVSVTQAGDSAAGQLILEMGDVYMSNTSVPGDADLMIGFGANAAYKSRGRRMISLPKNKLSGDHSNIPVEIDEKKTLVRGIKE